MTQKSWTQILNEIRERTTDRKCLEFAHRGYLKMARHYAPELTDAEWAEIIDGKKGMDS